MPEYDFVDVKTEEPVVIFMFMDDALEIGTVIEHEGRQVRRVYSQGTSIPGLAVEKPGGSMQVRKWHPDAPRHDKKGFPIFNNRREAAEFSKKNNDRGAHCVTEVDK